MEITTEMRRALVLAKRKFLRAPHPDVVSVGIGLKQTAGRRLDTPAIVFGVRTKRARAEVHPDRMLPTQVHGERTDVIERGELVALATTTATEVQELTQRRRPCPPGFSIGHPTITAGTLGAWVKTDDDLYRILSNNHVVAASNAATPGDWIIQPGKADGGFSENDKFARLEKFAHINFEAKKKPGSAAYWRAAKWLPNALAQLTGCPYRLSVHVESQGLPQPNPNLVDAAIARPITQDMVKLDAPFVGPFAGFASAQLGDQVMKVGRTTEYTRGEVVTVEAAVRVSYGTAGVATFDDQFEIESTRDGDFSAGGDSGSVILDGEGRIVGLLFAGGAGITIANRIGNVIALLGVRF